MSAPVHGLRITLERAAESTESVLYQGRIESEGGDHHVEVRVDDLAESPDGLHATARIEGGLEPKERTTLERTVATMARSAVRGARKDGRPAPRRIQRWRG